MKSTDVQKSTSPAIVGNNVLCPVVLDVLYEWHRKQSGWWYGYTKLMIDVRRLRSTNLKYKTNVKSK